MFAGRRAPPGSRGNPADSVPFYSPERPRTSAAPISTTGLESKYRESLHPRTGQSLLRSLPHHPVAHVSLLFNRVREFHTPSEQCTFGPCVRKQSLPPSQPLNPTDRRSVTERSLYGYPLPRTGFFKRKITYTHDERHKPCDFWHLRNVF